MYPVSRQLAERGTRARVYSRGKPLWRLHRAFVMHVKRKLSAYFNGVEGRGEAAEEARRRERRFQKRS